ASDKTAVYLLLTAAAPTRTREQVEGMTTRYGWPVAHQHGFPDLVGPEVDLYHQMQSFNVQVDGASNRKEGSPRPITALLVNQFGFSAERLGGHAPAELTTADLRRAADAELGMSTYEPFGIAQLEPMHAGAVCVTSTVCGCMGLVRRAMKAANLEACDVVIPADFVSDMSLAPGRDPAEALTLTAAQRLEHEDRVCKRLADQLAQRLPRSDADRERLLKQGQTLAPLMSWEAVVESDFLPAIEDALKQP
ncbi:MAG TPA: hypothetical protein VFF65_02960, partial [Phycisphaerales bacterium]|nr:hypothetical protein [Phycisphaerales bacterium]